MQRHHWYSTFKRNTGRWTKALAAIALLVTSTATLAQVDITSEVRQSLADCRNAPAQPEIKLLSAPPIQGKNTFEFAGSGPLASGSRPPNTVAIRVTRELVGGHTTIVRAALGYSLIVIPGQNSRCFVVDIPLSNPGTNEVRYIAELYDFDENLRPIRLISTVEARATFDVPIVTQPAPALSTWALILLAVLAAAVGARKLRLRSISALAVILAFPLSLSASSRKPLTHRQSR
jgi:hypothetical protein